MPTRSKAQFRFMQGIARGSISPPRGLSRSEAAEFVSGQDPKGLPERKAKKKPKKANTLPYPPKGKSK